MSLQLHTPDGRGGLERRPPGDADWRRQLRSPRWAVPQLPSAETEPTSTARAVLFWLALAALTFVLLVAGYGTGFWR